MLTRRIFIAQALLSGIGFIGNMGAPYTLIVIDVQEGFNIPRQRPFGCIVREIHDAIKAKANIVLVKTNDVGEVDATLLQEAPKAHIVGKNAANGSNEVITSLFLHGLNHRALRVCGCNTELCVYETVAGIVQKLPASHIDIVADACDSSTDHKKGLALLSQLRNVSII